MTTPLKPALRILLVDDEASVQKIVVMMLARLGHYAETASDGWEALRRLRASSFDVVLTDYWMSEMNGDELARRIQVEFPSIKIVFITGDAMSLHMPAEIQMLLRKPFSIAALGQMLSCLDRPLRAPGVGIFQVVVTEEEGGWLIRAADSSGTRFATVVSEDNVMDELLDLVSRELGSGRSLRVAAPEWIRCELAKRGYL